MIASFFSYATAAFVLLFALVQFVQWLGYSVRSREFAVPIIAGSVFVGVIGLVLWPNDNSKVAQEVASLLSDLTPHNTASRQAYTQICAELLEQLTNDSAAALGNNASPAVSPRAKGLADEIDEDAGPYALGLKATAAGRYDDARRFFELAEGRAAIDPVALDKARAEVELFDERPTAALAWLESALRRKPGEPALLGKSALALWKSGKYAEAEEAFGKAASAAPDDNFLSWVNVNWAKMYTEEHRPETALEKLSTALQLHEKVWGTGHPGIREIYAAQASAQCEIGEYAQAEKTALRALEIHEGFGLQGKSRAAATLTLAIALEGQGKYEPAVSTFLEAQTLGEALPPDGGLAATVAADLALAYSNWGDSLVGTEREDKYRRAEGVLVDAQGLIDKQQQDLGLRSLFLATYAHILESTGRRSAAGDIWRQLALLTTGPPIAPTPPLASR